MKRILSHLRPRDWAVVAAGFIVVVVLGMNGPDRQMRGAYISPVMFELVAPDAAPHGGKVQTDFEAFSRKPSYHGAFAIGDGGGYGWSDNSATQALADQKALTYCAGNDTGCRIVARLRPEKSVIVEDIPLSYTAAKALEEFRTWPAAKAIALTDHGTWGAAWNRESVSDAEQVALTKCRNRKDPQQNKPHGRKCVLLWAE